jgi:hypothetical protein
VRIISYQFKNIPDLTTAQGHPPPPTNGTPFRNSTPISTYDIRSEKKEEKSKARREKKASSYLP